VDLSRWFKAAKGSSAEKAEPAWLCGHSQTGRACRIGPSGRGACQATFECTPSKTKGVWRCRRPASHGGPCQVGPDQQGNCCRPITRCKPIRTLRAKRAFVSKWAALSIVGLLALGLAFADNMASLMPGPITTAHGSVENCSSCHSSLAEGQFGWLHTAFSAADPRKDSSACLSCHSIGKAALNPHGVEVARLEAYTRRLEATPASSSKTAAAHVRDGLFPLKDAFADGIYCATCHQEHRGMSFDLTTSSNARCQSCHTVQFDSFSRNHPSFESYPFRRRTRINFDHGGHFNKHFPDIVAKKTKAAAVPKACADCHMTEGTKGHMTVKPFAEVCSSCHLGQIVGAERATGPKGVALLALPGLDIETLKQKKAVIGEWPEDAEGEITPLMNLLIGWDAERRGLLKSTGELDLLDLTKATDKQIKLVEKLVWEIKHLIYAFITARKSEVFKRLDSSSAAPIDADLVAALTANIPRDVLMSAQTEWLPNLLGEIDKTRFEAWIGSPGPGPTASLPAKDQKGGQALASGLVKDKKPDLAQLARNAPLGSWRVDPFGRLIKGNIPPELIDDADDEEEPASALIPAGAADAENWAASGGWYRQDFAILYRPAGHADQFLHTWLELTAQRLRETGSGPAAAAFQQLTDKDAQGQCTKCHSVDAVNETGRAINWQPSSYEMRESIFTAFTHEPHFGVIGKKGCLACHDLNNAKGYLESYKALDPYRFISNFKPVDKKTCASCHSGKQVRDDCLLCHKYHPFGVGTPITATKLPVK
jgi:hypothetical protein